jgi:hypothetical protein
MFNHRGYMYHMNQFHTNSQTVKEEDEYAAIENTFDPAKVYWQWLHV